MRGYAPALAALALATALHLALRSTIGISASGTSFVYIVALLIASSCGFGPGYLALFLGVAVVPYLYKTNFSPSKIDPYMVAMLVVASTLTSWMSRARRETEEVLRDANEQVNDALRQQIAQMESLYNKVPVGLCFLDADLRYLRINDKLAALHGSSVEEHIGVSFERMVSAEFARVVEPLFREVLNTGVPVTDREISGPIARGRLEPRDWLIGCSRVETDGGVVLGLQLVIQDITERKQAERVLSRVNERLSQYTYVAAHDLQEPLRTVVSFSELARRKSEGTLTPETDAHLRRVIEAAYRMSRLISDVLTYSQSAAESERNFEPVDLDAVLNSTLDSLGGVMFDTNANVVRGSVLPTVMGDAMRFSQVFQNLISNAIKYRKPGVAPTIRIGAEVREGQWVISVEDNGQGFRQEYADQIFGIFKRLHGRSIPGSGIGLAICKAIVEHHGGRIWAQSEPGRGTTFLFTLPAFHQSEPAAAIEKGIAASAR